MTLPNPWFPFLSPKPKAKIRLFCFPPSGGGASLFRHWRDLLPDEVDVYAVQLPGRESRVFEKPISRMTELVPLVASAVRPYLDVPVAFFGHSMGGLVGFELARELRRAGAQQPSHLFISAARPPHRPDPDMHHALPDMELIDELRKMDGYPPEVLNSRELMTMLLPTIRADSAITETYHYAEEAPLSCALTTFAGQNDLQVSVAEVRAWRMYTTGPSSQVVCPGGHGFLTTAAPTVVRTVARHLAGEFEPAAMAGVRR